MPETAKPSWLKTGKNQINYQESSEEHTKAEPYASVASFTEVPEIDSKGGELSICHKEKSIVSKGS